VATPTPSPTPAPNLIADGGFESGLVAPWGTGIYEPQSQIFWGSANATATVVSDFVHSGRAALRIANQSPMAPQVYRTLSQRINVTAGAPYCLSFWARSQGSQPGILSIAVNKAWTNRASIGGGTFDWTEFAHSFTAEAAAIDIRLISENVGTVWLDDIAVVSGACHAD
jgi:hypothetical protein